MSALQAIHDRAGTVDGFAQAGTSMGALWQSRQLHASAISYCGTLPEGLHLAVGTGRVRSKISGVQTLDLTGPCVTLILAETPLAFESRVAPGPTVSGGLHLDPERLQAGSDRALDALYTAIRARGPILIAGILGAEMARLLRPVPDRYDGHALALAQEAQALELLAMALDAVSKDRNGQRPHMPARLVAAAHKVRAAIKAEPGGPHRIDAMARAHGVSASGLSRAFRALFNVSIATHVAETRLTHAADLLETGLSIARTAYAVGYSRAHFTTAFTRRFGLPPGLIVRAGVRDFEQD
jgi:AraC-like DNA-binding protein